MTKKIPAMSDDEWMQWLRDCGAYDGINIDREYKKLTVWCETNGKKPSRRRFTNWLNRCEPNFQPKTGGTGSAGKYSGAF